MAPPARSYCVTRTVRALELAAAGPLTATALAADLRIDARTARRLLTRLDADGMLRRLEGRGRGYAAGPRLVELARALGAAPVSGHGPARPRTG
jgi:DNA-binding IclR family transcriptional regulator